MFLFRIRQRAYQLVSSKPFDYIILAIIFANCVTIAMERPSLQDDSKVSYFVATSDIMKLTQSIILGTSNIRGSELCIHCDFYYWNVT